MAWLAVGLRVGVREGAGGAERRKPTRILLGGICPESSGAGRRPVKSGPLSDGDRPGQPALKTKPLQHTSDTQATSLPPYGATARGVTLKGAQVGLQALPPMIWLTGNEVDPILWTRKGPGLGVACPGYTGFAAVERPSVWAVGAVGNA
jgi:hypothetical protein